MTSSSRPPSLSENSRPELQIVFDRLGVEGSDHARLEIGHLARFVGDVIAVGVANRLAAGAFVHDVADDVANLFHRIRAAKNQEQDARVLALPFAGEIFPDIIANQFLGGAMAADRSTETIVSV